MRSEILALMNKTSHEDTFPNIVYNLMTQLHQPYSEIMNMPLPLIFKLLQIIDEENKKQEKEMKKGNKKW